MGTCKWCGAPVAKGYHHCKQCHQKHLRELGIDSDVNEEKGECKEEEKLREWTAKKECEGYLTINEAASRLHRSRRWLLAIIEEFDIRGVERAREQADYLLHKNGMRFDPKAKQTLYIGDWDLVLKPASKLIWKSQRGTLVSKDLLAVLQPMTQRREDMAITENGIFVTSSLASRILGCTRRWLNKLVKAGSLPGHYSEYSPGEPHLQKAVPALDAEFLEAARSGLPGAELEQMRHRVAACNHILQGGTFVICQNDAARVVLLPPAKLVKREKPAGGHCAQRVWVELKRLDEAQVEQRSQLDGRQKHPHKQRWSPTTHAPEATGHLSN